jgi:PhnB protein
VATSKTQAIPDGMHSLTPHIICRDAAKAIEFYERAFGAVELVRLPAPDGRLAHAAVKIGDSVLMLVDEFPERGCVSPQSGAGSAVVIHLYVPDVDTVIARATSLGAKLVMPASDMFWGDRYGQIDDPFGHRWSIATHVRDVKPEELQSAMAQGGCG